MSSSSLNTTALLLLLAGATIASGRDLMSVGVGAIVGAQSAQQALTSTVTGRKLQQVDPSQRPGVPTANPPSTGGSSNTANPFGSGPGGIRRIGALGPANAVGSGGSLSAADTTVVSGVRGTDNLASGSGSGTGSGSGSIGSNRGYPSTGGRKLQTKVAGRVLMSVGVGAIVGAQQATPSTLPVVTTSPTSSVRTTAGRKVQQVAGSGVPSTSTLTLIQNPDAGVNNRGAISSATPAAPAAQRGLEFTPSTGRRALRQRSSVATTQPTRAGTSTALLGTDRSAGSIAPSGLDTGRTGLGSGSSASTGTLASGNSP